MLTRTVTVLYLAMLSAACTKKNETPGATPRQEGENAVIDDALNAQLEALGYFKKEKAPSVRAKRNNPYENADVGHFFDGIDGTFVFYDVANQRQLVHNEVRANKRFTPQSTFKIPNTLIALESGAVDGPETLIAWDETAYPKESWWDEVLGPMGMAWDRDHTLRSAFKHSCVWYFRELAKRIGEETMQASLNKFDYGNNDISGGIDHFWLESSLRISAVEQVAFLKKLVTRKLPISDKTRKAAYFVFERERKADAVLYAKTGGGKDIGWFVGFIESNANTYVFALNMAGSFNQTAKQRVTISLKVLQELGVWF